MTLLQQRPMVFVSGGPIMVSVHSLTLVLVLVVVCAASVAVFGAVIFTVDVGGVLVTEFDHDDEEITVTVNGCCAASE